MSDERTYIMASTISKLTEVQLEHILCRLHAYLPHATNQHSYNFISLLQSNRSSLTASSVVSLARSSSASRTRASSSLAFSSCRYVTHEELQIIYQIGTVKDLPEVKENFLTHHWNLFSFMPFFLFLNSPLERSLRRTTRTCPPSPFSLVLLST